MKPPAADSSSLLSQARVEAGPAERSIGHAFNAQRAVFERLGAPTTAQRRDRLRRAIQVLKDHTDDICAAGAEDFGGRSPHQTLVADVYTVIKSLDYALKHLERWTRPERRPLDIPWGWLGARAEVRYQPLGVVGVVAPWNFPVSLAFTPLAGIFAAGNSVMLKPSELAPASAALIGRMISSAFDRTEAFVVQGGPEIATAFTRLPFDHLLFTGSTALAPKVLHAAADSLTPVTLELGGKSPAIIGRSANFDVSVPRLMFGKCLNAGQVCIAPDYVLVPSERMDDFVAAARTAVAAMFPTLENNPDYTGLISTRHAERLRGLLDEARNAKVPLVELNPADEDFSHTTSRKLPPVLVIDPPAHLKLMHEEIFGPILVVKPYATLEDALAEIMRHPKPLALYYFGDDARERETVLSRTQSGGVTINDVAQHIAHESLPFGGIGASGMGRYHGIEGFRTFSNARAVFHQTRPDILKILRPPHSAGTLRLLKRLIGR